MSKHFRQRWKAMPAIIQLVFVLRTFYSATALASLAELLIDDPYQNWLRRDVIVPLATFVACGAIAYGASSERRYTRALTTVVLVAAPFAKPEFSWLHVIASGFTFLLALLFLYWDDEVTDYFLNIAPNHERSSNPPSDLTRS